MTDELPDCHTFPASVFADFIFDQCANALASGCESDCDEAREWIAMQVAKRDARPVEDELRAEVERLRKALRPFAHCWQSVAQGKHSFDRTGEVPRLNTGPCGECRGCRARAAIGSRQ